MFYHTVFQRISSGPLRLRMLFLNLCFILDSSLTPLNKCAHTLLNNYPFLSRKTEWLPLLNSVVNESPNLLFLSIPLVILQTPLIYIKDSTLG